MPKLKLFILISLISLMINFCACAVALLQDEQEDITKYNKWDSEQMDFDKEVFVTNVSLSNFAIAVATSFLPFVDLINLAYLKLDIITSLVLGIIITLFGALKLFLLINIALGYVPFINT
jgi:hypothetical protein